MVRAARAGDVETAARCELALRGIKHPSREQHAGALLHALHASDVRRLREALVKGK